MPRRPLVLDTFLPYRLSYTANMVSEMIAGAYKSLFGLTIAEWRIVAHVAETEGISQQEICHRTRMDKVTISRAAIALTSRALLQRARNAEDRRAHVLRLTELGRRLYRDVAPKALELEDAIFAGFSAAEIETFVAMLRRVDDRIARLSPPER